MASVEASRATVFSGGSGPLNRTNSSPTFQQHGTLNGYSFPNGSLKREPPTSQSTMYRRPTYAPAQADEHDNHHHPQHPLANPDRPLSRPDSTCDNSSRQYYHHDHEMYGFPGPSGAMGGVDPGRSVSAANFEQLRHSIAASHEQVSHDYSGLGRQVVMSGAGQLGGGEENDYNDTASPRSHYQASYHQQAPNSFTQTGVQPQHLHPLQQQPAPTYIYGQLLHRPDYTPQDGFHQAGPEAGWGEGYQSPDDTQSVWRHPLNQGEQIPAHLLPPLPPVPQSHAPASATVPRPAPYAHVYTAYSISPSAGRSGQVGGRDGWGPSEPESPYTTFGSHYPDEPAYHHPAPGVINPAYVNPNAYTTRHSAYPIAQRYTNSPLKEEEDGLPARTSSKKAAKPRSTGGPAKPRQKSVIFHPTPQAMLAPEIRLAVAASALVPRGARENTPHIGTNAPPLPSEETFKTMMTKRSRGRRPPGQADLITEVDGEDPNLNPSEAQIAYCGVTKTGKPKKIFLCKVPECGKCFKRSEHLKRHVRSIHTNEKPFFCRWPSCGRYFSRHDNLNQHLRVHRSPNQSDASFSAQLEACFGSFNLAHPNHVAEYNHPDYNSDDDQQHSGQVSDDGEEDY